MRTVYEERCVCGAYIRITDMVPEYAQNQRRDDFARQHAACADHHRRSDDNGKADRNEIG